MVSREILERIMTNDVALSLAPYARTVCAGLPRQTPICETINCAAFLRNWALGAEMVRLPDAGSFTDPFESA